MMLSELIFLIVIGIIFFILGILMWKKQLIWILHSYHYKNVKEEDKKEFCKLIGISLCLISMGIIISGVIEYIFKTELAWIASIVFLIVGFTIITYTEYKYNGGFFGKKSK